MHYQRVFSNPNARMAKYDYKKLLKEDSIVAINKVGGMRFAHKFFTNLSPETSGDIYLGDDGAKIWTVKISSEGAFSINLLFGEFELPEGAELYIYNNDQTKIIVLTAQDNPKSGILPTIPIDGEEITVEYREPPKPDKPAKLRITEVNHDYRGFRALPTAKPSDDVCSLHASCEPEAAQIKQSVCLLIIGGTMGCTGTLINNTAQDGTPYILTAAHCVDNDMKDTDMSSINLRVSGTVAFFNYEAPNCNASIRGSEEFTIGGATLKAYSGEIDLALLELSKKPPQDFRAYYAGWNRTTTIPAPVRGIHHPKFGMKRIAIENHAPSVYSNSILEGMLPGAHRRIAHWETGTTQTGSSGSGLFDANLRLVGALTAGASSCSLSVNDYYYRFDMAWNHFSEPEKQLKAWLDPLNSAVMTLDGFDFYAENAAQRVSNLETGESVEKKQLQAPASGILGGQNSHSITEYAEKYTIKNEAQLLGVYLIPSVAKKNTSSTNTNIKVYAGNDIPKIELASQNIGLQTLQWSSTKKFYEENKITPYTNKENFIRFAKPVDVGTEFFVSYETPYTNLPDDSIAMYTAANRNVSQKNTAFAKTNTGWQNITTIFNDTYTSFWIDPVLVFGAVLKTKNTLSKNETVVFPNPVKNAEPLQILFPENNSGFCHITLFNQWGQMVLQQKITNLQHCVSAPLSLPLPSMASGVYYLRIDYEQGERETHKIILLK